MLGVPDRDLEVEEQVVVVVVVGRGILISIFRERGRGREIERRVRGGEVDLLPLMVGPVDLLHQV